MSVIEMPVHLTRQQATAQQLECAAQLFSEGKIVASVTLAAAATRVLFDLLNDGSKDALKLQIHSLYDQIDLPLPEKENFHPWLNKVYDWLRHADKTPDLTMEINSEEAQMWITLGIMGYARKFHEMTSGMKSFAKMLVPPNSLL